MITSALWDKYIDFTWPAESKRNASEPVLVRCHDCGMDTYDNLLTGGTFGNYLCFYCKELRDVRSDNIKSAQSLPRRQRRKVLKTLGWKPRATTGFG